MSLQVINSTLQVIGINAVFNVADNIVDSLLCDIDNVENYLYRGERLKAGGIDQHAKQLSNKCTDVVLNANNLTRQQVALISIDKTETDASESYVSINQVKHLSDALILSQQIITKTNVPVLIISSSSTLANNDSSNKESNKATISFDNAFESYHSLQGAGCVLLCSKAYARAHHSALYASIDKVSTGSQDHINEVINAALADIDLASINILEVSAHANSELSLLEQQAILSAYCGDKNDADKKLTTAISCQKSVLGENGCLSELMGLMHSVISLQQRYRPAIKDWYSPSHTLLKQWQDSAFYVFNQAAPVFPTASGEARVNTLSLLTEDDVCHVVLSEINDGLIHQNGFNRCSKQTLFIIGADNEQDLLENIHLLIEMLPTKTTLKDLANTLYECHQQSDFKYKVVLIADSIEVLNKELSLSLIGVEQCFNYKNNTHDWKTPKGSFFTSQPEKNAKTAFMYPGIGATYIGLGRDLFHLFPEIFPSIIKIADNIGASLKDELMNPRSIVSLDFKTLKQLDLDLRNSLANIAECGVGYACVFTKIFEQVFGLKADFSSGYSMGEISMFAALGCWKKPGLMSARLAKSDTFNHQLSSELRAVRKLWYLPDIEDGQFEPIWETYSIKGTFGQVTAAIHENERVYITIINTPDSLVIGGFPEDCLKVIERLGVRAMPLNMANAIHSEPAYQEYDRMLELYSMPVTERIETKMISSSCYLPIPQLQNAIAVSIAKCLCEPVDFPRLIQTLADKQTKVFIEMGAGRSLCSWTDKTLKAYLSENKSSENKTLENHISVPVNAKGTDNQLTYARAMAKLVSFGLDINLDSFFKGSLVIQVKHQS
jgi:PfaB family protein